MRPNTHFINHYFSAIAIFIILMVSAIFWSFDQRITSQNRDLLHNEGKAFFQEILLTRQWVAQHGGVYVKQTPGLSINPYLQQIEGLKVVIHDESGQPYILKNPALVAREISELTNEKGLSRFHITSLRPLNPNNAPDPFEQGALASFEDGREEISTLETQGDQIVFRYMAPLVTDKSCLTCHAQQGYTEGMIRGGISVTIDATTTMAEIRQSRYYLILAALTIIALALSIIFVFSRFFKNSLQTAQSELVKMANHDFLTGLYNRREAWRVLEEVTLGSKQQQINCSVLMLDLDHFKQINDEYGHAVGDRVLQAVALTLRSIVREHDFCCRYGGEEFLVILPETELDVAGTIAEQIRISIASLEIALEGENILRITASLGVAAWDRLETIDHLVSRADEALYLSKQQGRNKINLATLTEGNKATRL